MASNSATDFIDEWFRGVNYSRDLVLEDATGTAVDLSTYTVLDMGVEVIVGETGEVLRPDAATYRASYDATRGGAASGAITVYIDASALETGWEDEVDFNTVRWSVKGGSSTLLERPIFNCELTVRDTAFG